MPSRSAPLINRRALNRATLARQHLLAPSQLPVSDELEHLVGMQSQIPTDPYVALWSRYAAFDPRELGRLMEERRAVRMTLMRGTIHLVTARDALRLRPLLQAMLQALFHGGTPFSRRLAGVVLDELLAEGRRLIEERPLTGTQLRAALARRWPDADGESLVAAIKYVVPVVQVTPRGVWGRSGQPTFTTLQGWLGAGLDPGASLDDLVLRYLGAFGPASVMDMQRWSRLTRLRDAFERLRPRLLTFRDDAGHELFDLPEAPRPDGDVPVPVAVLPTYDNVLLGHADRRRFMPAHDVAAAFAGGLNVGAFLMDGLVTGSWRLENSNANVTVTIRPARPLRGDERTQLETRGEAVARFMRPAAQTIGVVFRDPA